MPVNYFHTNYYNVHRSHISELDNKNSLGKMRIKY